MQGFGYIYKTTNKVNGKIYIGQKLGTVNPSYLGSGVLITKALHKYGKDNFELEILSFASNRETLDALEIKSIAEHRKMFGNDFLYNLSAGGVGPRLPASEEKKEKLKKSNAQAYKDNPNLLEEKKKWAKERFSIPENNIMFGKHHTPETLKKISESNKNNPNSGAPGVPKSEESKDKIR